MVGFVKKLVDFAHSIGMPVSISRTRLNRAERPLWDGRVLHIDPDSDSETIAHEIAHYILATRSNRDKEQFGLRAGESSDNFRFDMESEADVIATIILTELGLPTFFEHDDYNHLMDMLSDLTHRRVLPLKQAGRYRRNKS